MRSTPTPHTDAWRERLAAALTTRGAKADLARYLAGTGSVAAQQVKIAEFLHQRTHPGAEFVLAAQSWLETSRK